MAAHKRTHSIADYFLASTKGPPVEKRPRGSGLLCDLTFYLPVYSEWLNHYVQRSEGGFCIRLMVYANELIFGAFMLKQWWVLVSNHD